MIKPHALVALCAFATISPSQTPPCLAANDQTTNVSNAIYSYSTVAPGMHGWQISSPQTITVAGGRVFTGNTYSSSVGAFMSLEIWSESSAGLPDTRLAGGTWQTTAATEWQGANLDASVTLQANSNYWLVFVEPGWSTPPIEPGGLGLPAAHLQNGTWSSASPAAIKFRLFCQPIDLQGAVAFGPLCLSSGGLEGSLFTNTPPTVGNQDFHLEGSGFPGNALTFLVLGLTTSFPTFPIPGTNGCNQSLSPFTSTVGTTGTGNVRAATALGHLAFDIPLPNDPSYVGFYFDAQLAAFDAGAVSQAIPFVTSNALQVTVY